MAKVHYAIRQLRCNRKSWKMLTDVLDEVTCGDCKNAIQYEVQMDQFSSHWRS